jgi:MOSC domain-containing protein YiiM
VTLKGAIKAISVSKQKGTRKVNVPEAQLRADFGIVGDAHAGQPVRQVSLLALESIEKMVDKGANVSPGDFAENITTEGLNLLELSVGTRLALGKDVELEIRQFGKKCHSGCEILQQVGDCVMPREGVFAKVVRPGMIRVGDIIEVLDD